MSRLLAAWPRRPLAGSLIAFALSLGFAAAVAAVPVPFDFYERGPYRQAPRPAEVLGYEPGAFHTGWSNMERYLEALRAAVPDRVVREPFGRTVEFRERSLFIVSSPANLAKLEAIRAANLKLADPRGTRSSELEALSRDLPVTVWLNYSIHGDESASFEAMMQVAYQLVAGEDSMTQAIRDHAIVLLNPAHNPDGHERFVTWINALGQGNPDPLALEQQRQQPWGIGGRRTHYQVDPNRDALAMSQIESRQMSREIRRWRPQVFVDHHGQVATFFFPPTAQPTNAQLPQSDYQRWVDRFGRGNAAAFDRYGWSYYVRDVFDFHYTGYWDIWPTLQGAIGMTYETDGGGNLALRRDDETVVTLRDGIARHFTASMATLATSIQFRAERLRDMAKFAGQSVSPAPGGPRAYVLDPGDDPLRAAALAENLLHAGVEVEWLASPFKIAAARPLWGDFGSRLIPEKAGAGKSDAGKGDAAKAEAAKPGKGEKPAGEGAPKLDRVGEPPATLPAVSREFPHGAFVIDLAQPGSRLARALLECDRSVDTAFARIQLEKFARNVKRGKSAPQEGYDFYDITAWALPVTYGVPAYAVTDVPNGGVTLVPPDPNASDEATETLPDSLAIGIPMTARVSRAGPLTLRDAAGRVAFDCRGRVVGGEARNAYVWSCTQDGAARLALRLMQEGFRVATAARPMRAETADFPRGSFLARVERNPATLHARVRELAVSCGVTVTAVQSAWTDRGDTGVGSEAIAAIRAPRIAVVVDRPVSPEAYGWLWFLLERRLGVRFTAVRAASLGGADLDRYNVLVIPDGSGGALMGAMSGALPALKSWIARGGALVCLDDAVEFPAIKASGLSTARLVGVKEKKEGDKDDDEAPKDSAAAEAERRPEPVPGTIFWATLDPLHFLSWGFSSARIPVLETGNAFLTPSRDGANAAMFDRAPLTVAGWTWPDTERRLARTAYAVDEPTGRGHVILIAGPPAFRLFWRNTERLLTNAILYSQAAF